LRWLALLRGVNVGGARTLPMSVLESAFRAAGADRAETVIQSGNVVFDSKRPDEVCGAVVAAIMTTMGFWPAIVLRSAAAWRAMVEGNPFVAAGAGADTLHVACLATTPTASVAARLDPCGFLPDEFVVACADVYLKLPNGVARANLNNARLDKALGTVSTLRNWRTALRLLERLEA
jgi:uncharacterized protein (DUF1697 family)